MKDSGFGCLRETGMESMRTATKKHRMNSGSVKKKIFLGKNKKLKKSGNRDME